LSAKPQETVWDTFIVFSKLKCGYWRGWPLDEQLAIEKFLKQWWQITLMTVDPPVGAGDVLTASGQAFEDLGPLLVNWRQIKFAAALQNFTNAFSELTRNALLSNQHEQQVKQWLETIETRAWLEDGYDEYVAEPWSVRLEECILQLKGKKY
jgi:hypothetical protein